MPVLAMDLGGTKLACAVMERDGSLLSESRVLLEKRKGAAVGALLCGEAKQHVSRQKEKGIRIEGIGLSVPGICDLETGSVWAPNIPGWEAYPILGELRAMAGDIPVWQDNDRACYILGESWQGAARGCRDVVFLAVGTGIGAGFLVNGQVLRGARDIAGAVGWMALERPYKDAYRECGCLESKASGEGMVRLAREILEQTPGYTGVLSRKPLPAIKAHDLFAAYDGDDPIAHEVIRQVIALWGMAAANLVSLFNPEKIIWGGGIFGPAAGFLEAIRVEAAQWAQPIAMQGVRMEVSELGDRAGLYGAGLLALTGLSALNGQKND